MLAAPGSTVSASTAAASAFMFTVCLSRVGLRACVCPWAVTEPASKRGCTQRSPGWHPCNRLGDGAAACTAEWGPQRPHKGDPASGGDGSRSPPRVRCPGARALLLSRALGGGVGRGAWTWCRRWGACVVGILLEARAPSQGARRAVLRVRGLP